MMSCRRRHRRNIFFWQNIYMKLTGNVKIINFEEEVPRQRRRNIWKTSQFMIITQLLFTRVEFELLSEKPEKSETSHENESRILRDIRAGLVNNIWRLNQISSISIDHHKSDSSHWWSKMMMMYSSLIAERRIAQLNHESIFFSPFRLSYTLFACL